MPVLVVGGEVGGARALLPVLDELCRRSFDCVLLNEGALAKEADTRFQKVTRSDLDRFVFDGVLFSTLNEETSWFLSFLRENAERFSSRSFFLLDNWMNYLYRLCRDGKSPFFPARYGVMDAFALAEATADGIPPDSLRIVGQPALANLESCWIPPADTGLRNSDRKMRVVFISEPVTKDQGENESDPFYRGYTERTVLADVLRFLQPFAEDAVFHILPHPRENPDTLEMLWTLHRGGIEGGVFKNGGNARAILASADGVLGMSSLLLYEAWLMGKPVLSYQPGLRNPQFGSILKRSGVFGVAREEEKTPVAKRWIEAAFNRSAQIRRTEEIERHRNAPRYAAEEILRLFS